MMGESPRIGRACQGSAAPNSEFALHAIASRGKKQSHRRPSRIRTRPPSWDGFQLASIIQHAGSAPNAPPSSPIYGNRYKKERTMTEESLRRVEGGLAITLPQEYWELMLTRGPELKQVDADTGGRLRRFIEFSANDILILNCRERKADSRLAEAMPKWWKQFLMFGAHGGGYSCVRLDGTPGVWKITAEAGPKKLFESLFEYVDHSIGVARAR
jgi:hypothetical protein